MADRSRGLPPLALPAVVGLGAYGAMVAVDRSTGTLRADSTPTTIGLYLLAFLAYGAAVVLVERRSPDGRDLRLLWLAPIAFRVVLLATEPTLSDDVYRYLWDGHVLSNGFSPYSYAVSAAEFDALDIPIRELVNNPGLASPYLPTTQLLFALVAVIGPLTPLTVQVVMVGFDLVTAGLIQRLLAAAGQPPSRVLWYLWHPLVVVEVAHGAHFDAVMTCCMAAAVLTAMRAPGPAPSGIRPLSPSPSPRGRLGLPSWLWSPLLLAAGTLTRPIPVLAAPVLWWRWRPMQRMTFVAVVALAVLPFGFGPAGWGLFGDATGTGVFGSARVYSAEFRFNAVIATWLESLVGGSNAYSVLVVVIMAAVGIGVAFAARSRVAAGGRRPGPSEVLALVRLVTIPLAAYVVLTPVLHPWYLLAVIGFGLFLAPAPGEPRRWWAAVAPWLYLSAAVPFSYLTYLDPAAFQELQWVRLLQWLPAIALAVAAAIIGWPAVGGPRGGSDVGRRTASQPRL